jgi:drug/metabolite transporter (DMT)-like permease
LSASPSNVTTTGPKEWAIDFLLLSAIWGASFLFMRITATEFGALPAATLRVGIAALFLLPLAFWRGLAPAMAQDWKPLFIVGALNSGIPFACFCFALLAISTGLSSILNATVPLFGAIIAWMWLGDRLNATRIAGLAVGFVGVTMLAWDKASLKAGASGIAPGFAIAACLLASICYGIGASFTKRHLGSTPSLAIATGSQVGATVLLAPAAIWLWPAHTPGLRAWAAAVAMGVLCTGVAYILYFRLLARAGPARALAVTFVVPVFAIAYGALFLQEAVTAWMVLCGLVIVAGTALSTGLLSLRR